MFLDLNFFLFFFGCLFLFGAGTSDSPDEEIIPNPDNVGSSLPSGIASIDTTFDPSNFLKTQTFGENVTVEGKPGLVINETGIENFFQEYGIPLEGSSRKVGGIKYMPDRYGKGGMPGDAGLGTLQVAWIKSGTATKPDEMITYDLNDEGSVLKLVTKMKEVGESTELNSSTITAIVNEFQRLKDVVKQGALRTPSQIIASKQEE